MITCWTMYYSLQFQLIKLFRLCALFFCLLNIFSYASEKIVIDTDAGGDDALAILMLLRSEATRKLQKDHFKIVGITCIYGNTLEGNVEANVLKTLTLANRTDVPVYSGSDRALVEGKHADNFFGRDGFGEMNLTFNVRAQVNRSVHSSVALIEFSKRYEGDLVIMVLGPTTNVALAMKIDEDFAKRVKLFYVSGGSIAGMANAAPNIEFNFRADPESNYILLTSVNSSQLTLFPWETALNAGVSKDWRIRVLGNIQSPFKDFINQVERFAFKKEPFYVRTDAMSVATYLNPKIITHSMAVFITAGLKGKLRGAITVNYLYTHRTNANLILSINRELLMETLLRCLTLNYEYC